MSCSAREGLKLFQFTVSDCGDPGIAHSINLGDTLFNGGGFFACDTGYVGGGAADCLDTGSWGTLPTCDPIGESFMSVQTCCGYRLMALRNLCNIPNMYVNFTTLNCDEPVLRCMATAEIIRC